MQNNGRFCLVKDLFNFYTHNQWDYTCFYSLEENKQHFRENEKNFRQIERENKKDSLDELVESDDEFQVSILRRKSKLRSRR